MIVTCRMRAASGQVATIPAIHRSALQHFMLCYSGADGHEKEGHRQQALLALASRSWSRVIRPPRVRGGHVILDLCSAAAKQANRDPSSSRDGSEPESEGGDVGDAALQLPNPALMGADVDSSRGVLARQVGQSSLPQCVHGTSPYLCLHTNALLLLRQPDATRLLHLLLTAFELMTAAWHELTCPSNMACHACF